MSYTHYEYNLCSGMVDLDLESNQYLMPPPPPLLRYLPARRMLQSPGSAKPSRK